LESVSAMLETLMSILLTAHLLAVNVAGAGPLLAIWLHRRCYRHGDTAAGEIGRRLAKVSVSLLTLGILLGALLLGLMWQSGATTYFDSLRLFPARKYWYTLAELLFYYACMWPYISLWDRCGARRFWHGLLAVLAATNLLYHFPPLMSVIAVIATRPEWQETVVTPGVFRTMMLDNEVLARVAHVWLASLATAGVAVMLIAARTTAAGSEKIGSAWAAIFGARIALVTTLAQLLVGVWLLVAVSARAQAALLGGDLWTTGLLLMSISAALGLMHQLATIAIGEVNRRSIIRSAMLLATIVLLMSGTLRRIQADTAAGPRHSSASPTDLGSGEE
jgi:hypothetical protein